MLWKVLFHYPVDSAERPHEKAREALRAAEALHPRIDRRLIGQVYLHYGHVDWAAEQFEQAAAMELASTHKLLIEMCSTLHTYIHTYISSYPDHIFVI